MQAHSPAIRVQFWRIPDAATRDLITGVLVMVILMAGFIHLDMVERIVDATRTYEDYELDEFIALIPAVALVSAWYAFRRWREAMRLNKSLQDALAEIASGKERRRDIKKKLHQAQKMEAIGQLASGIAHELNNLLQPVVSLSQSILRQGEVDSQTKSRMETILKAAVTGRDILRNTLIFAGHSTSELSLVPLAKELSEIVAFLGESTPEGIQLRREISNHPGHAPINPAGLTQVMTNLIGNAVSAVQPDGNVTVALDVRTVTAADDDKHVLPDGQYFSITVTDDGPGMTEAIKARIFEPFFTTRDAGQGTGLGLAVTYGIIKEWGGSIAVQSEPGQGSTFEVLIPRIEPAAV